MAKRREVVDGVAADADQVSVEARGESSLDLVDPAGFGAWGFEALLHDRLPRYQALADNFGYVVEASDLATVRDGDEFIDLMAAAIEKRMR